MPLHLALLGVGSPVASAFVPTDLGATLKIWGRADGTLWQDSARTTPVTANNDPVGAADDASGNANHCTQATSTKRLTYKTGIQNGLPGLLGDGTDDFLVTPSMAWFPSKRGTLILAWKRVVFDNGNIFGTYNNAGTTFQARHVSTPNYDWYDGLAVAALEGAAADTNAHILIYNRTGDTTLNFRRDGVDKGNGTITNNQPSNNTAGILADPVTAGAEAFNSYLLEWLYCDTSLSAGNVTSVETYLNGRWGVF